MDYSSHKDNILWSAKLNQTTKPQTDVPAAKSFINCYPLPKGALDYSKLEENTVLEKAGEKQVGIS